MIARIEADLKATWPHVVWTVTMQDNIITITYPHGTMYQSPMINQVKALASEYINKGANIEIIRKRLP